MAGDEQPGVYLLTTVSGLEDVAEAECAGLHAADDAGLPVSHRHGSPAGWRPASVAGTARCPGAVRVSGYPVADLLRLTTIHHILEVRAEGPVATVEDLRDIADRAPFPELDGCASFRVTATRVGEHPFRSMDLQRAAGGALHRRHGTAVDLDSFEVEVHVALHGNRAFVGLRVNTTDLGKRIRRARALRSSLKPTVAAAMLRMVGAHRGPGRLLDPMCGAGTIPLEARRINPSLAIQAGDWDPDTLEVARQTLAHHGVDVKLGCVDARRLAEAHDARFDYLVTDPPYGVRQARRTGLTGLYRELLPSFESVLTPNGRVALLVVKPAAFRAGLDETGLIVAHERVIDLGGLCPRIVILEPAL